ncbi:cupin domain-containing protein [Rhodococcus wratislaviensis]|uniref:cupin domain-containing protein n=1 Tax=Rhodococcus wratislaviensis TaxID=44752 RepID=UPI00365F7758
MNDAPRYVRPVQFGAPPEGTYFTQTIATLDSSTWICTQVSAGGSGPSLHVHDYDQYYWVIYGEMTVRLGEVIQKAPAGSLVHIPAGLPHCNWNEGDVEEAHIEAFIPAAQPGCPLGRKVGSTRSSAPAGSVTRVDEQRFRQWSATLQIQNLASFDTGSNEAKVNYLRIHGHGQGPRPHIHDFDQLYFVLKGTMTADIGRHRHEISANSLVILPAGIPHANWNAHTEPEEHVAFLVPQPKPGAIIDYPVDFSWHERELTN